MTTDFLPITLKNTANRSIFIAGPCSAESPEQMLLTARQLKAAGIGIFRAGAWKPRTRPGGFEGYGTRALEWLNTVKQETGMLTATEIGCAAHAELALKAGIDILWIGARTTASPFAVQEIADCLRGCDIPIMVKNPPCVDIELWEGAVERLYNCGIRRLAAIHRGFKTTEKNGYRNAPLWDYVSRFRESIPGIPMLCDPSHMGGCRDKILPISTEAYLRGYDGLIIESHYNPDSALTDSFQQITPSRIASVLSSWLCKEEAVS